MRSRRQSFAGKSLTDPSLLPRYNSSNINSNNDQEDPFSNTTTTTFNMKSGSLPPIAKSAPLPPPQPELSDEELAAQAAFEAILEMKQRKLRTQQFAAGSPASPSSPTFATQQQLSQQISSFAANLDADELHEFLGNFGLLSREALRDDLKVSSSSSPNGGDFPSPAVTTLKSRNAAAAIQPVQTSTVAENDFVDFLLRGGDGQKRMEQLQKRRGSAAWIDMAVDRHNNAIAKAQALQQQQQQQQMMLNRQDSSAGFGSSSPHDENNKKLVVATVVDLVSDDGDGSLRDDDGIYHNNGNGDSKSRYDSQSSEDTLAAIEKKLRDALEARANTPVPAQLKTEHELQYEAKQKARLNSSTASGGGMKSPSPTKYRTANYSPNGSRARSLSRQQQHNSVASGSSPSAMLRKHQQAQLEALLQVRRNGGSLLAARSSANAGNNNNNNTSSSTTTAGRTGSSVGRNRTQPATTTMAGFTVVRK